jgi:hypothetical protein
VGRSSRCGGCSATSSRGSRLTRSRSSAIWARRGASPRRIALSSVAIVAGEGATEERLATTLVIAPGRLDLGVYSVIDIHNGSVETGQLAEVAAGRV